MQTNQLSPDTLRPAEGKVVSLYLNLDPSEFASGQARSTAINSLLDEAERSARDEDPAVRRDVQALREHFKQFDFSGAHGVAVFVCGADDLLETIKLPRSVTNCVVIDDSPYVEPLVEVQSGARYAVVLVNRQTARIFRGSRDRLDQVAVVDDEVHGQHDQGTNTRERQRHDRARLGATERRHGPTRGVGFIPHLTGRVQCRAVSPRRAA